LALVSEHWSNVRLSVPETGQSLSKDQVNVSFRGLSRTRIEQQQKYARRTPPVERPNPPRLGDIDRRWGSDWHLPQNTFGSWLL
jgi:hypothetical protein